jgi:hypothetical protein
VFLVIQIIRNEHQNYIGFTINFQLGWPKIWTGVRFLTQYDRVEETKEQISGPNMDLTLSMRWHATS